MDLSSFSSSNLIYANRYHFFLICILGSNMPCTPEAVDVLRKANVLIAPAMAAGAGGVGCFSLLSYLYI